MQGAGKIYWGSDFTAIYNDVAWGAGTLVAPLGGGIGFTSVNEGSFASTVDESGGVLAITTDTADNDNAALIAGKFAPHDGKMVMHARFKISDVTTDAVFVGFAETMALDTPVMPAEFATATMAYNPGGMVGFSFDADGTTDDFRAVMGDGSCGHLGLRRMESPLARRSPTTSTTRSPSSSTRTGARSAGSATTGTSSRTAR